MKNELLEILSDKLLNLSITVKMSYNKNVLYVEDIGRITFENDHMTTYIYDNGVLFEDINYDNVDIDEIIDKYAKYAVRNTSI